MTGLTQQEIFRYARHFNLAEIGLKGQEKLKNSKVLLIGAGGLGSPCALYLAAAGVGTIGIVDFDIVDESNLQRQILHSTAWLGQAKLASAKRRLLDLNPLVHINSHAVKLTANNALEIFQNYEIIVDGSDNFATRYLANDAAFFSKKPLVFGAVLGFLGQLSVFNYQGGACYRCLFPDIPAAGSVQNCAEAGVLGILPGVIGTMQAAEVIKILLNIGKVMSGKLLIYQALQTTFDTLIIAKNNHCALCGQQPTIQKLQAEVIQCEVSENFLNESSVTQTITQTITAKELEQQLKTVKVKAVKVIDVREDFEVEICKIKTAIHIPLAQLKNLAQNFSTDEALVVYCKSGKRSQQAVLELQKLGFKQVKSLSGGILEWIRLIDSDQLQY